MRQLKLTGALIIALFALTIFFGSFFTVDQGYRGVRKSLGEVTGTAEPGLNFKMPLVHSVVHLEVRTQKYGPFQMAGYSKDIQNATFAASVNYHLNAGMVKDIYSRFGSDIQDRLIGPTINRIFKEQTGKFVAAEIVSQRDVLGAAITDALSKELEKDGVVIEQVQIENVDFDDGFEAAIAARMKAEVEVQQQRQILERDKVVADTKRVNADAEAYRITTEAKATAQSITIQNEALNASPRYIDLIKAQRWDGKLPTTMLPGNVTPMIDLRASN